MPLTPTFVGHSRVVINSHVTPRTPINNDIARTHTHVLSLSPPPSPAGHGLDDISANSIHRDTHKHLHKARMYECVCVCIYIHIYIYMTLVPGGDGERAGATALVSVPFDICANAKKRPPCIVLVSYSAARLPICILYICKTFIPGGDGERLIIVRFILCSTTLK